MRSPFGCPCTLVACLKRFVWQTIRELTYADQPAHLIPQQRILICRNRTARSAILGNLLASFRAKGFTCRLTCYSIICYSFCLCGHFPMNRKKSLLRRGPTSPAGPLKFLSNSTLLFFSKRFSNFDLLRCRTASCSDSPKILMAIAWHAFSRPTLSPTGVVCRVSRNGSEVGPSGRSSLHFVHAVYDSFTGSCLQNLLSSKSVQFRFSSPP